MKRDQEIKALANAAAQLLASADAWSEADRVRLLNAMREQLHEHSPFKSEPVDLVRWVPADEVQANDYNPNTVAPPEMRLLELSIREDGYTQPVVTWLEGDRREVVDGFHRNRVARESAAVKKRVRGYLPVVTANESRTERADRMASTIRHNRARGKHSVDAMSDIVVELKKRNRSEAWIAEQLGMDPDEVLRLCQVSGLVEVFADAKFSRAWEAEAFSDDEVDLEAPEDGEES